MSLNPAWISAAILVMALILFVSERVRHDLIAVGVLIACVAAGLVAPEAALAGFGDPAVATVASVLIVGRALEMTGVAARLAQTIIPAHANFSTRLGLLIVVAAMLSAPVAARACSPIFASDVRSWPRLMTSCATMMWLSVSTAAWRL